MNSPFYVAKISNYGDHVVFLRSDQPFGVSNTDLLEFVAMVNGQSRKLVEQQLRAGQRVYSNFSEWERVEMSAPSAWLRYVGGNGQRDHNDAADFDVPARSEDDNG